MKNILVVIDHIGQDGTGRFITYLVNELTKSRKVEVTLMMFHDEESKFDKLLSPDVNIIRLHLQKSIGSSLHTIYKSIVNAHPDFCLFGYTQLLMLGYLAPLLKIHSIKVVFRETIIPTLFHYNDAGWKNFIYKHAYHRFSFIIAQSDDMKQDLVDNWGCNEGKIIKVNNPVDMGEIRKKAEGNCPSELINKEIPTFVSAGRLAPQKGYDIIINRISEMKPNIPFRFLILGDGHLQNNLQKQIEECGVGEYVKLLGFKTNVPQYIKNSDGLFLSSRYEGFPNIVLEALALGKPVFSNTCPGGINEIIRPVNGVACDFTDTVSFQNGLHEFIKRANDSTNICRDVENRFGIESIMQKYEKIFSE